MGYMRPTVVASLSIVGSLLSRYSPWSIYFPGLPNVDASSLLLVRAC